MSATEWLARAEAELAESSDVDEGGLGSASDLATAKLITAADIARALDSPCPLCRRAEAMGKARKSCHGIGCNRWSARRARRWMRRSQCVQRLGEPPCPARSGSVCHCQIGVQLWPGGVWTTTLSRLRERFPDIAELVLVGQDD